ncbi:molybdopterin biosynthesis protein [Alkalibaculum sp. M08DMB]|uniref:Molybdopterin molybdenumtransferase n=1 Tax=Alkalibaculum sporogenes TaxID=2655001 RepID=A0A6A7KB98_9FIRM|nr:molybdopterin biosynthesis protein [Alkalibaculum sporogenes]MPW26666.1 molybdopterin biosynthesis protein [Alkalibaculum sporogenes]
MEVKTNYKYLENISLEEALEKYIRKINESGLILGKEEIPVEESYGRITCEGVFANISSPHYSASAMDGISLMANKTFGATPTTPVILKEIDDFVWLDTGDPLPSNCDAVVMVEDVIKLKDGSIQLISSATPWQHIRQIGEDICAGEMILPSNSKIEAASIGAMLAGGVLKVKVWEKPIIGLIPTGDEIVAPKDNPKEGEIIEFNSSIFSAMIRGWGGKSITYKIIGDKLELIKEGLAKAAQECHMIVLNAGSSAGRDDYSAKAIGDLGEVIAHGISIKPGKPTILGVINKKPVIGVPGYPVSGIIVMEKLFKRVLQTMQKVEFPPNQEKQAILSRPIMSTLKYKEFVRMKLGVVDEKLVATPLNRGAGVVTSFVKADGILEIPLNLEGIEAGSKITVQLLKDESVIKNTLVAIGSHDPLLDTIYDLMRKKDYKKHLSSAHVGSMGGIMAIKRGEAHLAAVHLLDERSGVYNSSFIKKYFPKGGITLVKGVKRLQGLMTVKGNPKGIKNLQDMTRDGVVYVNRQKGSGTRILLDYLLACDGIKTDSIYGYEREEFTHMAVAAQIASGSADTGLGIFSAANIYNLNFIPLYEEEYDFIIPERFLELEDVQNFLEILTSKEFEKILKTMGGYKLEQIGQIHRMDVN